MIKLDSGLAQVTTQYADVYKRQVLSRLDHGAVNGLAGKAQIGGAVLIVHILGRIAGIQVGVCLLYTS